MRDIRGDLQERADLLAKQIGAAQEQFDKIIEQLKQEHATRLDDFKFWLDTVRIVIRIENRGAAKSLPGTNATELAGAQPRLSQPDLLARRVAAVSAR